MKQKFIIGIDQSTQGTKAILFDEKGNLLHRTDRSHAQLIDERGWVEHDPEEIYRNTLLVVEELLGKSGVDREAVACVGISNQRETAMAWNRNTGKPVYNAIVWQCARGEEICRRIAVGAVRQKDNLSAAEDVRQRTGLKLSPYFSAAKLAWIMEHVEGAAGLAARGELCCGTMDSYLVYRLTKGKEFRTDYSNASRTQLFHIRDLKWDETLCGIFGIPIACLPEVTDSDGYFGMTDFEGILPAEVPIHGVMGDSHGALFGQGCLTRGMMKTTYGTGSSIMMNIGKKPVYSNRVVTSLAWKLNGEVNYVLEGNINYTGAVITWLKDDLKLIASPGETEALAFEANPKDHAYLVPAFTGLGAPYWDSEAEGILTGMTRTTKRAEIVRAGLDCIAYQITDVVKAMSEESGIAIGELRVDGGPTRNKYLMQFQSDIAEVSVQVPSAEELSGIGAAYAAGIAVGIYDREEVFSQMSRTRFSPKMDAAERDQKYQGWKKAVAQVLQ